MTKSKTSKSKKVTSATGRKRGRPSKADQAAREAEALAQLRRTDETPEQRVKRISERFTVMYRLTQGVISGAVRSMIVSGATGTGKSHTIDHLMEQAKDKNLIRYETVKGALTGVALYKLLYQYSAPNDRIVIDDADSIYEDEDAMNVLKAGLDSTAVRKISWLSESNALKADDVPTNFVYEGSMIFITNKDFQSIVDYGKSSMVPHFQALMSRSIYLDLKLHDPEDLIAWIGHMVRRNHILVQRGVDRSQEEEAMEWLDSNFTRVRELSIRTALKVADFMKTDATNWESFANVTLLR